MISTDTTPRQLQASGQPTQDKLNQTDVVLVTGGAGFMGQHLVHLLQTRAPAVKEIRVLDLKPYKNILGHDAMKPVKSFEGCVTDFALMKRAMQGVSSVYHVAGKISYGTFPDYEGMKKINVEGTSNVINACLAANVPRLIYCSTVDVAIGNHEIINGTEETTPKPSTFLFPGYPESKYRGECLVLKADASKTFNGDKLHTLALRANVMYGEGDPYYVTSALRSAHKHQAKLHQVGNGTAKFQQAYVGNTAWAFLCADEALKKQPSLGGHFYYTPDDTPVQNSFQFLKLFLEPCGFSLSHRRLPYAFVYIFLTLAELIVHMLLPVYRLELPSQSYTIKYINMNLYFSRKKAEKELGFQPIYTACEAAQRSISYYTNLKF